MSSATPPSSDPLYLDTPLEPQNPKRRRGGEHIDTTKSFPPSPPPPPSAAKEATTDSQKEQETVNPREAALRKANEELERQIKEVEVQRDEVVARLREKDARKTVQQHIKLLHDYNEVRDVALGLMGLVADNRGCEMKEVMAELGLDPKER